MCDIINDGIDKICLKEQNAIEELFDIKKFVSDVLKKEAASPQYQLQKFYPNIYENLHKKQFNSMLICVKNNLERGIKDNLYRDNLNIDFIARIYFTGFVGIKNEDTFAREHYDQNWLTNNYLEYHLRAITTTKGLRTLEHLLNYKQN